MIKKENQTQTESRVVGMYFHFDRHKNKYYKQIYTQYTKHMGLSISMEGK